MCPTCMILLGPKKANLSKLLAIQAISHIGLQTLQPGGAEPYFNENRCSMAHMKRLDELYHPLEGRSQERPEGP